MHDPHELALVAGPDLRRSGDHGFICECSRRTCRERIYISESLHQELRRTRGALLSPGCAKREQRFVLRDYGRVLVVHSPGLRA